jgi:riboflavin kinase/FMN adenylyltransferase
MGNGGYVGTRMRVIGELAKARLQQETILTIGTFDGVHRGHQALIGALVAQARATGCLAAVLTFHPHPVMILAPSRAPRYLTTPGEKLALLESLGVDLVVLQQFNQQVAATSARDFMEMVSRQLRVRELWVGADFALGKNREGDVPRLQELGRDLGYDVQVFEKLLDGEQAVSSSRIRSLLDQGRVQEVAQLLGRYPHLSGEVVVGAERGHRLGFPTANLHVHAERATPADGVYAVFAMLGNERRPAVANIGVRPSFDNGERTVETHILDFDQDIYGCDLVVEFVARLRDERKFEDIGDLVAQIGRDSQVARRVLDDELRRAVSVDAAFAACRYCYREVEHTADRALEVQGVELADLFVGAARGMFSLMGDLNGLVSTHWKNIELAAWDRETLLVDWLNELLFITEMEGLLFVECRIESLCDSAQSLDSAMEMLDEAASADLLGAKLVAQVGAVHAPVTKAHIKAATFHNLALVQDESGWSTVLTFDV